MKLLPVFDALRNQSVQAIAAGWIPSAVRVTPQAIAGSVVSLPVSGGIDRQAEILVHPQDWAGLIREWAEYGDPLVPVTAAVESILGMPVVS